MVSSELLITIKNLVLPAALILATTGVAVFKRGAAKALIILALLEYVYFFTKYQPFAPAKFVFPPHPVFNFLQKSAGESRFYGSGFSYIDNNFATYYRVFSPEGYDPLYIRRYEEFLAGKTTDIPRSDAWIDQKDAVRREKSLDLVGVKYFVDVTDKPDIDTTQNFEKFPGDKYGFAGQVNKWKFYERHTALPRTFLAGNFEKPVNPLGRFYNADFDPRDTLLLEAEPNIKPEPGGSISAVINSYESNRVVIDTASEKPKLLFLSDSYYSGWRATVDGKDAPILRADYTFRAVALEAGSHRVVFTYRPDSFSYGLAITLISLIVWAILLLLRY